jgi:hypothetical protein
LIGSDEQVDFQQNDEGLLITVPEQRSNQYAAVFKIEGVL